MSRLILLALAATVSFAQAPAAAPPKAVDKALRARVSEFYQYHVTEQYRKAEKLVAADSQDAYYVASKQKYEKFEIKSIEYRDKFTKARVFCQVEAYVHGVGFEGKPVVTPSSSDWKLENGRWVWYVSQETMNRGPMGPMANAGTKPGSGAKKPEDIKIAQSPEFAYGQVKLSKNQITVKPFATEEMTITNEAAGIVSLVAYQVLPGIKVTFDKEKLGQGEKATVTMKCDENPHGGQMAFQVHPLDEILWFDVKREGR